MGYNPTFDARHVESTTLNRPRHIQLLTMAHGKSCTINIGWCAVQKSDIFKNHQNRKKCQLKLRVSSDSTENAHQSNGYRHAKLFSGNLQQLCHRLQYGPSVVVVQRHSQMDSEVVQHSAEAWQRDEESHLTWNPGELEGVLHSPGGKVSGPK